MLDSFKRLAPVLGMVALLALGMYAFFWPKSLPPPDESLRVAHPSGYSIIRPAGFEVRMGMGATAPYADGMNVYDPNHRSPPPTLAVQRFASEPDWVQLERRGFRVNGQYQGQPCKIMIGPTGRGGSQVWNHRAVVKLHDSWFEVGVADPRHFEMPGHAWEPYFQSLRYDPPSPATNGS